MIKGKGGATQRVRNHAVLCKSLSHRGINICLLPGTDTKSVRNYGHCFDFDQSGRLQEGAHDNQGHGWIMPPEELAIRLADRARIGDILVAIDDVPVEANQMLWLGSRRAQDGEHVLERRAGLAEKVGRKAV